MGKICVEYVWLGGKNELRAKTKVIDDKECGGEWTADELPWWNYDGSSTWQAEGHDSEVYIKPRRVIPDPFRKGRNLIVLCDTYLPDLTTPHKDNTRVFAAKVFSQKTEEEPWFGIEQEYFLMDPMTQKPFGFPKYGLPPPQGQFYCSVGAENAFCRDVLEEHLQACIYSGIGITGINFEVCSTQAEYQVLAKGIDSGDQIWLSRYLLQRVAEKHGVVVNIDAKPVLGDWNGSGGHTNYSTKSMREGTSDKTGLQIIEEAIDKLAAKHKEHIEVYGADNHLRLTGHHETASIHKVSHGRANRGASVRIPSGTIADGKGYFEDRRPAANMDPYLVTAKIFETTVLN